MGEGRTGISLVPNTHRPLRITYCPLPIARTQMEILYLLIPLSVVLVFLIGGIFWWSVKSGQFDDLEGPAHRLLDDDEEEQG